MIKLELAPPKGTKKGQLLTETMSQVLYAVSVYAMERITWHAQQGLKTTFLDYHHALQDPNAVQVDQTSVTITLTGKLANTIEKGTGPYDLKPGLLKSAKVKTAKDGGKYIDVPFRHGLPGSTTLKPMSRGAATNMAQALVQAKRTGADTSRVQTKQRTKGLSSNWYTRKAGIYDQMTRLASKTPRSVQYRTFRRISMRSAQASWMHPGFKGLKAFEAAAKDVQRDMPRIVRDYLKAAGL